MRFLTILIGTSLGYGCSEKRTDARVPDDFYFRIKTETFQYDSEHSVYTRSYAGVDSTIAVSLTSLELQEIYTEAAKFKFNDFPKEFFCTASASVELPAFVKTISIYRNGEFRESTNTTLCEPKKDQRKSDNFNKLYQRVYEILNAKKEIENISKSNLIFL
ncbi:hypothetical protein [Dyadobacter psychrotolerans]|uniref:Lipoprotein n=1 Tax=Dyadobacter psychrotolerans TaxID=2541721 RepID=A0A4R5DMM4_9BACT|nr:hypothetical protein [Dyadobacter psychrotolerans]TDE15399.1 hypothetical protein E0F88_12865 [Dyadobacter psychrotolerans]